MTATVILPGARVRTRQGLIGTVERVEPLGAERDTPGSLRLRADDGSVRFPYTQVR